MILFTRSPDWSLKAVPLNLYPDFPRGNIRRITQKYPQYSALSYHRSGTDNAFGLFTAKSTGLGRWLRVPPDPISIAYHRLARRYLLPHVGGHVVHQNLAGLDQRSASRLEQTPHLALSHLFKRSSIFSCFLLIFPQSLPLFSSRMGCDKHSVPKGERTVAFLHSFPVGIQYVLPSCQRTDQHHQCGLGRWKFVIRASNTLKR